MQIKHWLLATLLLSANGLSFSQVGIGTLNPHQTSILEIESSSKGFLPPRMTRLQRNNILNPAQGLMVYCSDCCPTGSISFFNSKIWKTIVDCTEDIQIADDFDGDGIPNLTDIDDDNDGILDELECPVEYTDFTGLSLSTASGDASFEVTSTTVGNPLPANITIHQPTTSTSNTTGNIVVGSAKPGTPNAAVIRLFNPSGSSGEIFSTRFDFSISNRIEIFANSSKANSNITSIDRFTFEPINPPAGFQWNYVVVANAVITTSGNKITVANPSTSTSGNFAQFQISSNVRIEGFTVDYETIGGSSYNSGQFLFSMGCSDNDGDGIPNYLDLDSDNDGCSDAFESGMTTNTQTYYSFPAPHGANGLADVLETGSESGSTTISPVVGPTLDGNCL
ncbi:MAG: hypothetical protein ACPGSD_06830 [Flavobacteriales bacterium]